MPGARHPAATLGRLDDLDEAATAYAGRWSRVDPAHRARLRDDLICRCLPFADRMARRYAGRTEPLDDLQQVARVGLIKAVDRYDPGRGSFTAFAVTTISGEIKHHFRDRTWSLHVARRVQDLILEISHATVVLTNTLSRAPTTAELADHLHVTEDDVRQARTCAAGHVALPFSTPVGDGTRELGDLVGDRDPSIESLPDRLTVAELVQLLPDRMQHLLTMRFHGNLTQAQIAAELGVSQMHVSRLLHQALTWLHSAMLSDSTPPWTGTDGCRSPDTVHVAVRQTRRHVSVDVLGEVDRDNADRLRMHLHAAVTMASGRELVIDITGVPMVDAAGATVLRDARVTAGLAQVTMAYRGMQPQVARVLMLLGMSVGG